MSSSVGTSLPPRVVPGNPLPYYSRLHDWPSRASADQSYRALTEPPNIIETARKTFYPLEIPITHEQLRHYLGATDDDTYYYASRNEIYALRGEKRQLVAWVDFLVQCLAAGHGWICVGGPEKGRVAFRHYRSNWPSLAPGNAEDDEQLSLNLTSSARSGSPEGLRYLPHARPSQAARPSGGPAPVFYKKVGSDIVNSITIQKITPESSSRKPEVVALLSNNDKTITVFSLDQMCKLKVLSFDYGMNHASITSDGKLLIACGDTNKAFFFAGRETNRHAKTSRAVFDWSLLASPDLAGFPEADHCFSTAFSPDERFCTVASQSGMLAKYDVSLIQADMAEDEAIAQEYCSSRPATHVSNTYMWSGAIGSVSFSPGPRRLLAWAERRGRVCVADLDHPIRPPQVVELAKNDPENVQAELSEASPPEFVDIDEPFNRTLQQLGLSQSNEGRQSDADRAADYIEDAAQRSRLQEYVRSSIERGISPFEDQPRLRELVRSEVREVGTVSDGAPVSNLPPPPRRRSSVVLGQSGGAASTSSSHPSSLAPILPTTSTLSASPSRLATATSAERNPTSHSSSQTAPGADIQDAWQTISAAMSNAFQDPRRASLQQNLRTLRETRESLERAHRIHRSEDARRSQDDSVPEPREVSRSFANTSPLNDESGSAAPTRRSASVTRIRRSAHASDSGLRSALEDSISESQVRLRHLERDLDQIDREHRNFTVQASRLWQDSSHYPTSSGGSSNEDRSMSAAMRSLWSEREERMNRISILHRNRGDYLSLNGGTPRDLYYSSNVDGCLSDDELGVMGMAWSSDGTFLYVATTNGIFKMSVNGVTHQTFPAPPSPL